jgi:hypothetical protein
MSKDLKIKKWCRAANLVVASKSYIPGAYRNNNGLFSNISKNGNWWSATENNASNAWNRNLNYNSDNVNRSNNS